MREAEPATPQSTPPAPTVLAEVAVGVAVARDLARTGRRRGGLGGSLLVAGAVGVAAATLADAVRAVLVRVGAARRVIRIDESFVIERPVPQVFAFMRDFANFPNVFAALRCVDDFGDGRSHWEAVTPAGHVLRWDAVISKYVPNAVIGWRTLPGGDADLSGMLRFAPAGPGATRVTIRLRYFPRETPFTDALHAIVRRRPEDEIRGELARLQAVIPSGELTGSPDGPLPDVPTPCSSPP